MAVISAGPTANALMDSTSFLSRADLASHLKVSLRTVDRFVLRHDLRSGPGRAVLVPLSGYAWCLVSLRRDSTRSMTPAPAVRRDAPRTRPVGPGEELVLVAQSAGLDPARAARGVGPRSRLRALEECPDGHWGWSIVDAAQAMAGVLESMAHGASRPEPGGDSSAARYLREFLREASANSATALDAASLTRCLRRLPANGRQLLLQALSGAVVDVAREGSHAPLDYARAPLLTEAELASEVRRTVATVRRWRVEREGPVFVRIERAVRYSRIDVNHWLGKRLGRR